MGLTDFASRILTTYRADTSDHRAQIRGLRGEEQKRHKALLQEVETQNRGIDKQIAMWGKVAVGVGLAVGAFKLAQKAATSYLEDVRLESAAAGVSIDKLTLATRGLLEHDKLLEFAGKAQHGVWKLTEQQLEVVAKGTDVLAKRMGIDLTEAMDMVTESLAKGTGRGFKPLGVEIATKADLLRVFGKYARFAGEEGTSAAEKFQQASVKWKDAVDDLMGALGQLAVALGPVIAVLSDAIRGVALLIKDLDVSAKMQDPESRAAFDKAAASLGLKVPGGADTGDGGRLTAAEFAGRMDDARRSSKAQAEIRKGIDSVGTAIYTEGINAAELWLRRGVALSNEAKNGARAAEAAKKIAQAKAEVIAQIEAEIRELKVKAFGDLWKEAGDASDAAKKAQGADKLGGTLAKGAEFKKSAERGDEAHMRLVDEMKGAEAESANQRNQPTKLEQILGTPEQINAQREAIVLLAGVYQGFSGAMAAGFDAMITGSESFSKAFTKAIAEALRALAGQMFVESLKHAAMAIGSLAFGNFIGAGEHAAAAGLFAAGAVAAGVAAHELGGATGQWSHGGGASSGGGRHASAANLMGSGSGGAGGGNHTTIILGADFYDMTRSEREARLSRAVRRGEIHRTRNVIDHR